jgi:transcriptional regulator
MYIPKSFAETDGVTLYQFMRDNNFAAMVTEKEGQLTATHLPFLIDTEHGVLRAHLARTNDQWQAFDGCEALVIFQGPHAYVSPTWNYTAVHVYGVPQVVEDEAAVRQLLRDLVANHERGRDPEWSMDLPEDYLHKMMLAIVAFEVPIERIEGKYKLSQNRSEGDQASVIAHLSRSPYPLEAETARFMASRRSRQA